MEIVPTDSEMPAASRIVSPGRKNPMSSPHSANRMIARPASPKLLSRLSGDNGLDNGLASRALADTESVCQDSASALRACQAVIRSRSRSGAMPIGSGFCHPPGTLCCQAQVSATVSASGRQLSPAASASSL